MAYEDQFNFKEQGKCFWILIKICTVLTTNIISEWSRHNKHKIGTQFMAYWFLLFLCQDRLQLIQPSIPGKFVHLQPNFCCLWVCRERQYHEFSITQCINKCRNLHSPKITRGISCGVLNLSFNKFSGSWKLFWITRTV